MSTATLNAIVVTRASVHVPAYGCWWADVDTESDVGLVAGDAASLAIADITCVGSVVTGGPTPAGGGAYRIVAGTGGWRTSIVARPFFDDRGVSRSSVITTIAGIVGESIGAPPATRVGTHYAVRDGLASAVLHELCPRAWYVDLAGVARFGARATVAYTDSATRTKQVPAARMIELAPDTLAALVPGVSVDDLGPALDVEYVVDASSLRVRVYGGERESRDLDSFRRIVELIDPRRLYRCPYEYRVVSQEGELLNLQPVRVSSGMPDLARVPVRLAPGVRATHLLGSLVTVQFLDGDPSLPRVTSGDDAGAPGWMPTELDLGSSPRLGVARMTDTVVCGPFAGTITSASTHIKAGL